MATGGRTVGFARQCRCRLSGGRLGPNYPARRRSAALPAAARAFPASLLFARRSSPRRTPKKPGANRPAAIHSWRPNFVPDPSPGVNLGPPAVSISIRA
jgi:hypothetical protein